MKIRSDFIFDLGAQIGKYLMKIKFFFKIINFTLINKII